MSKKQLDRYTQGLINKMLFDAVELEMPGVVRALVKAGASPNATKEHDWTVLHAAVHRGNAQMVRLLLKLGADKRAEAENGATPISVANDLDSTYAGDKKVIVKLLLVKGGQS